MPIDRMTNLIEHLMDVPGKIGDLELQHRMHVAPA